jgi:acyl-CoA synthetase (AMP-forming)/AMP-acid ligase II
MLLRDPIDHWASVRPDDVAITFEDQTYTWAAWRDRILKAAGALRQAGIQRGDRIAVLETNHLATVELTFAASSLGAATVILNRRLAPGQIQSILGDCRPVALLTSDEIDFAGRTIPTGQWEEFIATADRLDATDAAPDDPCLVLYTSGTTGHPKGAMLTHRSIRAQEEGCGAIIPMGPGDVSIVVMPLFHVGGICYAYNGIRRGVETVLLRQVDGAALAAAVAAGATHVFLVPTIVGALLEAAPALFSRMKMIGYGAAPMPLPMVRRALAAWPDTNLVHVYGMTELSGAVTLLLGADHRDAAHPERLASAGRPIPGAEVRVVDPATLRDVEPGERGELWFRTDATMLGYLGDDHFSLNDGWLRTGDIGRVDGAGYVYVLDRLKDMIITGGENVYCPEVENVLCACPGVAEGVVIGVPDSHWGETVKAFVTPSGSVTADEVIAFCRERLAHYQCPTSVEFAESLPRNATGKVLKHVLREPYWPGLSPAAGEPG